MCKPNSASVLIIEQSGLFWTYLEFQCSDMGDSSWGRTLSTLDLKEYEEPVSNMERRHWKMNITKCPSGKIGKPTS